MTDFTLHSPTLLTNYLDTSIMRKILFAICTALFMWVSLSSFTVGAVYQTAEGDGVLTLYKDGTFTLRIDNNSYRGTYNIRREPMKGEVIPIDYTIGGETETYNWTWPLYGPECVYIGDYDLIKVRDI